MRIVSTCNKIFLFKHHVLLQRAQHIIVKFKEKLQICCSNVTEREQHCLKGGIAGPKCFIPLPILSQTLVSHLTILCTKFCRAHSLCQTFGRHQSCGGKNRDKVLIDNHIQAREKKDTEQVIITINSCLKEKYRVLQMFLTRILMRIDPRLFLLVMWKLWC